LTLTFFEKLDFSPSLLSVIRKFILPPKGLGENPSIVICETIFHLYENMIIFETVFVSLLFLDTLIPCKNLFEPICT